MAGVIMQNESNIQRLHRARFQVRRTHPRWLISTNCIVQIAQCSLWPIKLITLLGNLTMISKEGRKISHDNLYSMFDIHTKLYKRRTMRELVKLGGNHRTWTGRWWKVGRNRTLQYSLKRMLNTSRGIVANEAPGFDFSPNNPIIVICISVTDRNM